LRFANKIFFKSYRELAILQHLSQLESSNHCLHFVQLKSWWKARDDGNSQIMGLVLGSDSLFLPLASIVRRLITVRLIY
jgi:hypothetical protein